MRTQVLMATIGLALTGFGAGYPSDLIYYSKMDSAAIRAVNGGPDQLGHSGHAPLRNISRTGPTA